MGTPREHIESIRKNVFKIGQEPGAKDVMLHHAIRYLSDELYTKDVHFLMELIQNAEDNEYPEGVNPSLDFVITSQDITATGAPATLIIYNNEMGFSPENINAICALGCSTKKENRKRGKYIGEKGIGFKSVFLITARPYVFSNGYQIRFSEEPCPECKIGFVVPEWINENSIYSSIQNIYGSSTSLPTTTFVLPLKPDKVKAVKQQLSNIHPEVLLFLSKIKTLSVKETNDNPKLNSVSAVSILRETEFTIQKNIDAESFTLHLSADEKSEFYDKECSYYMWRQRFPVKKENTVEKRKEVNEWVITLAFPFGNRLNRGGKSPGVYAYLPTEMVTNFPFIIQADFLLPSSRETILLDNKWNKGILDCVPAAFVNAIASLVKSDEKAPLSSLPRMFEFLPVNNSPYPQMDLVRNSIKLKLANENIVPCESYMEQRFFRKPSEVGRLMSEFWTILDMVQREEVDLKNISSHGRCVLASSFDTRDYDKVLDFLGVMPMDDEWYANCIRGSNLVLGVSGKLYLEILIFLAEKWSSNFQKTSMRAMPLIKYVDLNGVVNLCSANEISEYGIQVLHTAASETISWLLNWNNEFRCHYFFLPKSIQEEISRSFKWHTLLDWFSDKLGIKSVSVRDYASLIADSIKSDKKLVITFAHFLYHSRSKDYLSIKEAKELFTNMPIIDNYGNMTKQKNKILIPASGSNWVSLVGSNIWRKEGVVVLGEGYLCDAKFAGVYASKNELLSFLKNDLGASDIPFIDPPNEAIPTLSAPLTKNNTYLLLDWIKNLRSSFCAVDRRVSFPYMFLKSIKEESWLKISMNGSSGHKPPSLSFFPSSSWGLLLQDSSILVDIPIVDISWYGNQMNEYTNELKEIGVMFEFKEACEFFGKHVMSLVSSSTLTRDHVYSILKFIKFLREKFLSPEDFIRSIKDGQWLMTSLGYRSPVGSVLFDNEWGSASEICEIPFISQEYYGDNILSYKTELQLLGVLVGFNGNYEFVMKHLKSAGQINAQSKECGLFVLKCLQNSKSPEKLIAVLKNNKFLMTNMGFKAPSESYHLNPEWGCLLQVFSKFPLIDEDFYGGNILVYKNELEKLGVIIDFENATKAFVSVFKEQAGISCVSKGNVLSILACIRKLNGTTYKWPSDFTSCIREVKWLRTRLGDYREPKECILFGSDWESIAPVSLLPFIDDSKNYYGKDIYEYEKELKNAGVLVAFEKGCKLVASRLHFPADLSIITPANTYAVLECIRFLKAQKDDPLPDSFLKNIQRKWVKTTFGYKSPNECLLFGSNWTNILTREDGPFIDEQFYGLKIVSYSKELKAIGVKVETENGCSLLASHLDFHSESKAIVRIYNYLQKFYWKPETDEKKKIWVPNENGGGKWEKTEVCVLWDKDGLFAEQLNVLDKSYDSNILEFFACALCVMSYPCIDDYCKLWNGWERSDQRLTHKQCSAFWQFLVKNWSEETEKIVSEKLLKLPVNSEADEVLLVSKSDVFIGDDLLLKDIFQKISSQLFVWFPKKSSASPPRFKLLEIYRKIGVRNISESVEKELTLIAHGDSLKPVIRSEFLIGKTLVSLILGFLARPVLNIDAEKRHQFVKYLLGLKVFETDEPFSVVYKLVLSSGEILATEAKLVIRWEKESEKIIVKKMDKPHENKSIIEYATYFSKVISEGLLWENEMWIEPLTELIRIGFFVGFDEGAIGFLMKSKNLELFEEDHKFLSFAFPTV